MARSIDHYFAENTASVGLGRTAMRSGALLMAARLVNVVIQVGSTIFLARLLEPHEFGLATMVLALTAFAPFLVDLGTTDASSQKPQITRQQISSLFWINVVVGAALTLVFAAASGLIASSLGEPALVSLAIVSSLTFVLTGLSNQHYSLMRRAMEFDRVVMIDLAANLISTVVAIAMAFGGMSYWALILKPLLTLALAAVGTWSMCRWVPGRPRLDSEVWSMVRLGLGVTGFTLTDQVTRSADKLALGYYFGPGPLGYFQNAYLLYSNAISVLAESLHNVAISGLSKFQNDQERLRRSWAAALSLVSFVSTAAFSVLAATGPDVIGLLLGDKWAPAGILLSIFAIRGIAHSVERSLGWLHVVGGRTDRWTRWGVFSAMCQLLALAAGLPFGATGVAVAYAIVTFALFVPAIVYSGRPFGIGAKDVLAASGPQVLAALAAAAGGYTFLQLLPVDLPHFIRIVAATPVCLLIYLAVAVGVFRVTEPLRLAFALAQDITAKRIKRAG